MPTMHIITVTNFNILFDAPNKPVSLAVGCEDMADSLASKLKGFGYKVERSIGDAPVRSDAEQQYVDRLISFIMEEV